MSIRTLINFPIFLLGFAVSVTQAADNFYTVGVAPHGGYVILGGTVIPLKEVTLSAQMAGRVESIAGLEGDDFNAGVVLLAINDDDLQARRQAAQAQLSNAHNAMQNARVQYNREMWNPRVDNPRPMAGMGMPSMFDGFFNDIGVTGELIKVFAMVPARPRSWPPILAEGGVSQARSSSLFFSLSSSSVIF